LIDTSNIYGLRTCVLHSTVSIVEKTKSLGLTKIHGYVKKRCRIKDNDQNSKRIKSKKNNVDFMW